MVFSSLLFLYAFLPLSLLGYALCRTLEAKNTCLLIFSLIFYAWGEPVYVLLLLFMAFADWFCALKISRAERSAGKLWLALAIVVDLSLIGVFKYAGFFCSLFGPIPPAVQKITLPIGISFYTFQLLTYVIDVYRKEASPQQRYRDVLLYAALFHQCIAGPIVRYQSIAEELFVARSGASEIDDAVRRFCIGLAKKALLANPCGAVADSLLIDSAAASAPALFADNLARLQSLTVLGSWLGIGAFTLQIYLDFSAYSDMAIGLGKMLGLHYPENFNYPYLSRSVTEFWRRWHMTLGAFFRDYVYIPLGGNRVSRFRNVFNVFVVWFLTGLWHGASWNFVLWGMYFFVLLMVEKLLLLPLLNRSKVLSHLYLLLAVILGWVIFHYTDVRLAQAVLSGLFGANGNPLSDFLSVTVFQNNIFLLLASCLACTPLFSRCAAFLDGKWNGTFLWETVKNAVFPIALLFLSTCALVGESYNPFLYFQF